MCIDRQQLSDKSGKRFLGRLSEALLGAGMRTKIVLFYFAFVVIPFVVVGWFYSNNSVKLLQEQTIVAMESDMLQRKQNISVQMEAFVSLANFIANDRELNSQLRSDYPTLLDALDTYHVLWHQYDNHISTWKDLVNITIYSANDAMLNSYPYLIRKDAYLNTLPEYGIIEYAGLTGYWSGVRSISGRAEFWSPRNQQQSERKTTTFTFNRAMVDPPPYYRNQNILTIEISTQLFDRLIETREEEIELVIMDPEGKAVALSGILAVDIRNIPKENWSVWEATPSLIRIQETDYYVSGQALPGDYRLIGFVSLEKVLASVLEFRNSLFIFLFFTTICVLFLVYFLSGLLTRRTNRLMDKIMAYQVGVYPDTKSIGGHDEIGVLDREFDKMAKNLHVTINEKYVLELQKAQAQLLVLQTQVNPHFLYNALSAIAWLSDNHPKEDVRSAAENLALFYRINLSKGNDLITIREELTCVSAYLELQKLRYIDRILVEKNIEDAILDQMIPKMTLQPLIENAIRHGMAGERSTIEISIDGKTIDSHVEICLSDDGVGMEPQRLAMLKASALPAKEESGTGFNNVHQRIQLHFGKPYGLEIESSPANGTTILIRLPYHKKNDEDYYQCCK